MSGNIPKFPNLEAAFVKLGLPHYKIAKILGISPTALSKKITGKNEFVKSEIDQILSLTSGKYEEIFFESTIS